MKIAIPVNDAQEFSPHYGAATALACFTAATDGSGSLANESLLHPVGRTPCSWPDWLHAEKITTLLVGGMGPGARARCAELGIDVIPGVLPAPPRELALAHLGGRLQTGENACRHGDHEHVHHHHEGADHAHHGHCDCAH